VTLLLLLLISEGCCDSILSLSLSQCRLVQLRRNLRDGLFPRGLFGNTKASRLGGYGDSGLHPPLQPPLVLADASTIIGVIQGGMVRMVAANVHVHERTFLVWLALHVYTLLSLSPLWPNRNRPMVRPQPHPTPIRCRSTGCGDD
jgi:hypothetical protein